MKKFEPKILAFLCNWCAYAGADLAGVSRLQYPPNMRVVRVMCSGRVDPEFIIDAFLEGLDGVLVGACHMGDCHYLDGNVHAEKKMQLLAKLLDLSGIGKDRLHFATVSSAEARRFVEIVNTVVDSVKKRGPLDTKKLALQLEAAKMTVTGETMRWLSGKEVGIVKDGDVYGRNWDEKRIHEVLTSALESEYQKNLIYAALKRGQGSVRDIDERIGLGLGRISFLLSDMERGNQVEFKGYEGQKPIFSAM